MDWSGKIESLIAQLEIGDSELFNQLANDAWFNQTMDYESRLVLADAIADKIDSVKNVQVKWRLLKLMGWANSELACKVSFNDIENATSAAIQHVHYLYESVTVIARERSDLFPIFSLASDDFQKILRLSFALLNNRPILNGDCLEAGKTYNLEFDDFLEKLRNKSIH